MSRYRKIHTRMWGDEKFRSLSLHGQFLFVYLLTSPYTNSIPGLFTAGEAGMAEALGWTMEIFREAFQEISASGMALADWKARVVWIPKSIIYNSPESPNVVRSWASHFEEIPECVIKTEALQILKTFVEGLGEGFRKAFQETLAKGLPNQEQEQEHPPTPLEHEGGGASVQRGIEQPVKTPSLTGPKLTVVTQEPAPAAHAPTRRRRKSSSLPPHLTALFEKLWRGWPKKDARADAETAFGEIEPAPDDALVDRMLTAIKVQADINDWRPRDKERRRFIPLPASWIRGERWKDEVKPSAPSGPQYDELWACQECGGMHKTPKQLKGICHRKGVA